MKSAIHASANAGRITRVAVLGHSGFIGGHLVRFFGEHSPEVEVIGQALPAFDLTRPDDVDKLVGFFDDHTAVLMCAAIKRQLGDNLDAFARNVSMAVNLCRLLERRPVARFVFLSSAAVYGEEITDLRITEETPARPTSFYGAAKFACECLFRQVVSQRSGSSLLVLRPALIYGPGDQGGYGPSGFVKAAVAGRQIVLWGDGMEQREFVYIDDLIRLVHRLTFESFEGVLNVVSGRSCTFAQAIDLVARRVPLVQSVVSRPRTKPKADHAFQTGRLLDWLPDFSFTPLEEGIRRTAAAESHSASQTWSAGGKTLIKS